VRSWFNEFVPGGLDADSAIALTQQTLAALSYSDADCHGISLWDRLPYKVLVAGDGLIMIDYSAISEALLGVLRQIGFLDGNPANVKATNFEDEVLRRGHLAGFRVWEAQCELIAPDGAQREIDASFIAGTTLVIVECKAFAQNPRIDRGDFAALKARRETLERYLGQAQTLAEFIKEHPTGRNYRLPEDIEKIDYLLCTPGIEYIWKSSGQALWFAEDHPRIVPPAELLEILSELSVGD
jgi:hypothetical protein